MSLLISWLMAVYVEGIVASIGAERVYWSEVVCRGRMDGVALSSPEHPKGKTYVRKRVYDRLIIDYYKLQTAPAKKKQSKELCQSVTDEGKTVLEWLKRQQTVWGPKSEESFRELLERLEQQFDVSW